MERLGELVPTFCALTLGAIRVGGVTNCDTNAKSISMNTKETNTFTLCNQCDVGSGNTLFPNKIRTSDTSFDALVPARTKAGDETEVQLVLK